MHAGDDNHTLGSVGNGLGHNKCVAQFIDMWVGLCVSRLEHYEQVMAHDKKDGDRVGDTDRS